MPRLISEITEIATGLGMLGGPSIAEALAGEPPAELVDVDRATWERVREAWQARRQQHDFLAAFANGAAFLRARDALRERRPLVVEWRGPHRFPGDEVVPADLRVDHVFLVSCKYLSRILVNTAPAYLFERCLAGAQGRRNDGDWFASVAPAEHQHLYQHLLRHHAAGLDLPLRAAALDAEQRRRLRNAIPRDWHSDCAAAYAELAARASAESARRWAARLPTLADRRAMLWRLLRIGSAPYFVLGTADRQVVRIRVATPWDWHRRYELRAFDVSGDGVGQPRVAWSAEVRDRHDRSDLQLRGHVEIRWSHGRFNVPPEAKVYLDTRHSQVPGYLPLT